MGSGQLAQRFGALRHHRNRLADRSDAGAQRVERRIRRAHRFADLGGRQTSFTGDRTEFLGRNGTPERPAALERGRPLSGKVGAALDPCAALQTVIELRPGARVEIVFFLGQAENKERARELIARYRAANLNKVSDAKSRRVWDDILGAVQVTTPDPSMDLLLNRWLLYQTLSCRVWARARSIN